jgi:hypothetical protein
LIPFLHNGVWVYFQDLAIISLRYHQLMGSLITGSSMLLFLHFPPPLQLGFHFPSSSKPLPLPWTDITTLQLPQLSPSHWL